MKPYMNILLTCVMISLSLISILLVYFDPGNISKEIAACVTIIGSCIGSHILGQLMVFDYTAKQVGIIDLRDE